MRDRAVVTSALPYANGELHIGHMASTYLPADVTARYLRMRGAEVCHVCATDDYGTPILIQAEREGKTPAEYVAHWHRRDAEDLRDAGVELDAFGSTSSPENAEFVRGVFEALSRNGHVYERDVTQHYCEADAKFLPDRFVLGSCPHCGAADQYSDLCEACGRVPGEVLGPRCAVCGGAPVRRGSRHHFFRLSSFAGRLSEWLASSPGLQGDVKRYVQGWIDGGLEDWDITRDIPWGVPVPGPGGQTFYGWFDNHLAYITAARAALGGRAREFWNGADVYHFIGKDIVYHHYLFLPAIRMGIGCEYKLPDYMPVRGHLTLESRKISKSRGWYIGLRQFLGWYPADYLRFYLASTTPLSQDDRGFAWADFARAVNSELVGNVGNLANRALGFVRSRHGGIVPERGAPGPADEEAAGRIRALPGAAGAEIAAGRLDRALRLILEFSASFNRYFQHAEPWKGGPGAPTCVNVSANAVRSLAIALWPFVPSSAGRAWAQLGLAGSPGGQPWDSAGEAPLAGGHRIGEPEPLFARVEPADAEARRAELGRARGGPAA